MSMYWFHVFLAAAVMVIAPAAFADDGGRLPAGETVSFDYAGSTCTLTFLSDGTFQADGRPALCSGWNASWVVLEGDVMITYQELRLGRTVCGPWPDYRAGDVWQVDEAFAYAEPSYTLNGDPLCWLRNVSEAHLIETVTVVSGSPE